MARSTKRLAGPVLVQNAATTLYTVPADTKAIVRHLHVYNPGADTTFTLSLGADAAGTRLFDAKPIAEDESFDWYPIIPMAATEILQILSAADEQLVVVLSGDEETL